MKQQKPEYAENRPLPSGFCLPRLTKAEYPGDSLPVNVKSGRKRALILESPHYCNLMIRLQGPKKDASYGRSLPLRLHVAPARKLQRWLAGQIGAVLAHFTCGEVITRVSITVVGLPESFAAALTGWMPKDKEEARSLASPWLEITSEETPSHKKGDSNGKAR